MSGWTITIHLVLGLGVLTLGAEALVRGASRLAAMAGISSLVIGLTIVAFGTSAPEMVVSVKAGLAGNADISLGNVVGSNIFNVLLILGACAVLAPLMVARQLVRLEVPIMIGASALLWVLALGGRLGFVHGLVLFALIVTYTVWTIRRSRREVAAERRESAEAPPVVTAAAVGRSVLYVAAGLALLVLGAGWFVDGSVALARVLGVSDLVIGLTIVAAGTSMPELATSVVATLRGERDIAIGNIVGSNIFNVLAILGVAGVISPGGLTVSSALLAFDIPVMTAVAVACLPIFWTGYSIARLEGMLFLAAYGAYTAYLVLQAQHHDALPAFAEAMLAYAIPLAVLGIGVSVWRSLRSRRSAGG